MKRLQSTLQPRRSLWVQAFSGFLVWLGRIACTLKIHGFLQCSLRLLTREFRQPQVQDNQKNVLSSNLESSLSLRLPAHGKRQPASTKHSHPLTHPTTP